MTRLLPLALILPTAALAHSGDHGSASWGHALTQPDHLLALAAVAALAWFGYRLLARK